ncbi:MAG: hypothetical protein WAL83_09890, partial [Arenicellales bacterium]
MTSGFDANVPARKPHTRISRVISDLTSGPQDGTEDREDRAVVEDSATAVRDAVADPQADTKQNGTPDAAEAANASFARVAGPSTAPPKGMPTAASSSSGGREQIARLRERLAAAAHPWSGAAEPKRTAAAVRDVVDGLRERMESSVRERSELAEALAEARATLAHTDADLQKERRAREALEAQAEE